MFFALTGGEAASLALAGLSLLVGGSGWFLIRSSSIGQYADATSTFNKTVRDQHDEIEEMQNRLYALERADLLRQHWLETSDELLIGVIEYLKMQYGDDLEGFNGRYSLWLRQRSMRDQDG